MNFSFRRFTSLATPFPLTLAIVHAVLTVAVFWLAIVQPTTSGLLPLVIFVADIPCSYMILYISRVLPDLGYTVNLLRDAAAFLLIGTVWWFVIGVAIRKGVIWIVSRKIPSP